MIEIQILPRYIVGLKSNFVGILLVNISRYLGGACRGRNSNLATLYCGVHVIRFQIEHALIDAHDDPTWELSEK